MVCSRCSARTVCSLFSLLLFSFFFFSETNLTENAVPFSNRYLYENQLTGVLPASWSALSNLQELYFLFSLARVIVPGIEPITKVTSLQSTIWSNSCHLVSRPSSLSQSSAFVRFYFYAVFWFILTVYSKGIVFESIKWTSSFRLVCSQQSSNTVCCFPILLSNALMVSPWNFSDIWETINSLENFLTLGLLSLPCQFCMFFLSFSVFSI